MTETAEITEILAKYPQEIIVGEYHCDHPEGIIFLGNQHIWFHSRERTAQKRIIEIEIKDISQTHYASKEQSLRIEMKGITHFFHSVSYAAELYRILQGKKQGWYAEYNALMHSHFKIPSTECLIECIHCTVSTSNIRNRPGTLYVSQHYVGYTLRLSDERNFFSISSIKTAAKENSLLTAKGIKIATTSGEFYFSGFLTRRTHVLDILLELMNITKLRVGDQKQRQVQDQSRAAAQAGQIPMMASNSDFELDAIESDFTKLSKEDSVKHEAQRESKVLDDAYELSHQLDEQMVQFLVAADTNHFRSILSEAIPVVKATQHTINSIRELGLVLLVDIMKGNEVLPPVVPPAGLWDREDAQTLVEMAQMTSTRLISQHLSTEDTLTPISGGLYTITKTLLQCFLRVKKHFTTLFEFVQGKKHHLVPSLTLKKPTNKLKLYNEQMTLLVNVIPIIVSISLKPDSERLEEFKVEELLERLRVKSFWYEYQGSLKTFVKLLNSVTAALSKSYQYENSLVRYPVAFMVGAAYAFDSEGAEKRVEEVAKNLDPKLAKFIWNLPDKPFIRFFDHLTIASVDVSKNFEITPNEPGAQPIHCKIISAKHPPFDIHRLGKQTSGNASTHHYSFDLNQLPVILHFHGGGFVSMSPESHEVYLREWARITQAVIISVDYKQAPEYKYPIALNECFNVYKWLIEGNLGFVPRKITLVGDSAGGNLVASTTLRAIAAGIRVPESAVLIYPALNLVKMATPSRIINMNDPIVSYGFLQMCLDSYLPSDINPWDMFISPLYAHEKYLKAFPTTYIMGMAFDPLLDDYVAFTKRLKALGKDVFFKLYEDLPHGVLNMVKMIPDAKKAIDDSGLWLRWSIS